MWYTGYTLVLKPIVTYVTTLWWPKVKYKISKAELSKLQQLACLGITGVMRPIPTVVVEVHLGLPPLYLQLEVKDKARIYRLDCNDQ
jgi:hypothetical protein